MANALTLLRKDHEEVKDLFKRFGRQETAEGKRDICNLLQESLRAHTAIEEEIFYPTIEDRLGGADAVGLVSHAREEHQGVKNLLDQLELLSPSKVEFDDTIGDLRLAVEKHIEEEEEDLFPRVEEEMSDVLEVLGTQMEKRKRELIEETVFT